MKNQKFIALSVAAVVVLSAVLVFDLWPKQLELNFETISHGTGYPRYEDHMYLIVENSEHWEDTWFSMVQHSIPPPEVDFSTHMVVALFLGERSTGGFAVSVEKVIDAGSKIVIKVKEIYPGRIHVTEALTWPHHIIKMERPHKPIVFALEQFAAHSFGEDGKPYEKILYQFVRGYQVGSGHSLPEPVI